MVTRNRKSDARARIRYDLAPWLCLGALACTQPGGAHSRAGGDAGAASDAAAVADDVVRVVGVGDAADAGAVGGTSGLPICNRDGGRDGGIEGRFAARVVGGGPAPPGTGMLAENGWRFLLVDSSCRAWVLPGDNDELLQLTLSPTQEQDLARAFKLEAFAGIVPDPGGCSDAPAVEFRWNGNSVMGPGCGALAGSAWSELNRALDAQLAGLAAAASPVGEDIRYLLVAESTVKGESTVNLADMRKPVPWPLLMPTAASVAIGTEAAFQYRAGNARLATGSDAATLRSIRTTSKNGAAPGGGGTVFDYTPVIDAAGNRYRLYVRDEVPFTGPDGLFALGTF